MIRSLVTLALVASILLYSKFTYSDEVQKITHKFNFNKSNSTELVDVYLPQGYSETQKTYPVLYTTAGKRRLDMTIPMLHWLTHVDWSPIPQMVVVTVPTINEGIEMMKDDGAAGKFDIKTTAWLAETLIPFIDKKYRTQPFRILEGFSSYGNYPLYVFQNKPQLFQSYISLNPALSADKNELIKAQNMNSHRYSYKFKNLFVTLGNMPENKPLFETLKINTSKHNQYNNFVFEDNQNIFYLQPPVTSLTKALTDLFSDRMPNEETLRTLYNRSGITGIENYFNALTNKYGSKVSSNPAIESLASYFTAEKSNEAVALFKMLIERKPSNIYYKTRLAYAYKALSLNDKAESMLKVALQQAQTQNDDEAYQYLKLKLATFKQN